MICVCRPKEHVSPIPHRAPLSQDIIYWPKDFKATLCLSPDSNIVIVILRLDFIFRPPPTNMIVSLLLRSRIFLPIPNYHRGIVFSWTRDLPSKAQKGRASNLDTRKFLLALLHLSLSSLSLPLLSLSKVEKSAAARLSRKHDPSVGQELCLILFTLNFTRGIAPKNLLDKSEKFRSRCESVSLDSFTVVEECSASKNRTLDLGAQS